MEEKKVNRKILLINACARKESRTLPLARKVAEGLEGQVRELNLFSEDIVPLDASGLEKRDRLINAGAFDNEMFRFAREFAEAEEIVIAAPYWDLSFPAILKCYLEQICVNGITFKYGSDGMPQGLCRASNLTYVTTSGGYIGENNFGFDYVAGLCKGLFGLQEIYFVKAEGLDIYGADVEGILEAAR